MLERSLRAGELVAAADDVRARDRDRRTCCSRCFSPDVRSLGVGAARSATASWRIIEQLITIPCVRRADPRRRRRRARRAAALAARAPRSAARCARPRQDADTAELVGVNARAVYARATAIAVATAALAGVFLAMRSTFDPYARPDAADLRLRGGRDRRHRLAVGHAARRHRPRRRPDGRRADRPAVLRSSPGTSSSSPCSPSARGRRPAAAQALRSRTVTA